MSHQIPPTGPTSVVGLTAGGLPRIISAMTWVALRLPRGSLFSPNYFGVRNEINYMLKNPPHIVYNPENRHPTPWSVASLHHPLLTQFLVPRISVFQYVQLWSSFLIVVVQGDLAQNLLVWLSHHRQSKRSSGTTLDQASGYQTPHTGFKSPCIITGSCRCMYSTADTTSIPWKRWAAPSIKPS